MHSRNIDYSGKKSLIFNKQKKKQLLQQGKIATSKMNENLQRIVKNRVVTALLQAYHDCLDYDGMKSILREANMLELKDVKNIDPEGTLAFPKFKQIIDAQNILMIGCADLLNEIGKKFSFYLFPFGKSFEKIIRELKDLIQVDWNVEILERTENFVSVKVENCIFSSKEHSKCELLEGFLINSLQKTLSSNSSIEYVKERLDYNAPNFLIKLLIQ